jgi:4-diphosphocytidyl-2-C-methyl-D-erythritol kinase
VHLRAHAKVNLALSVGPPVASGPRAGYHPIASWIHAVSLWDDLDIDTAPSQPRGLSRRPARDSTFDIDWADDAPRPTEIDWPLESDLAVRALRLLESHAGEPLPVRLRLRKRIPVGAGLGGGSSDAAAVLLAVNDLFGLGLPLARLVELSTQLGSDIAFFLDEPCLTGAPPRPALVTGFGERIERTPAAPPAAANLTLYFPPFGCPTADVYRAYDANPVPLREQEVAALARAAAPDPARLFNDLLPAAERVRPELAAIRKELERAGISPVLLSGSGSTLFAMMSDAGASRNPPAIPGTVTLPARLV